MFGFTKRRRKRLMQRPFRDEWLDILQKNVPYYRHLPADLQHKLRGLITIFLDEKTFEGCAGLEINDDIRVTVAAQACVLMLGIEDLSTFYENLRSILVYPETYVAKIKTQHNSFFVEEGFQQRSGEAWQRGHVVLAWDEVKKGASDIHDGQNLVFHEFAHQLDYEYGATEQIEEQSNDSHYLSWAKVVGNEYKKFLRALHRNQKTLINSYGATNLAEFFAVITECFFEKPVELKRKHPQLYRQLQQFYHQDPAEYLKKEN